LTDPVMQSQMRATVIPGPVRSILVHATGFSNRARGPPSGH
jgi:hypothetical protein